MFLCLQTRDGSACRLLDLQDFSDLRTLSFYPPDGEFAVCNLGILQSKRRGWAQSDCPFTFFSIFVSPEVMNYRITGDFRVPFRTLPAF